MRPLGKFVCCLAICGYGVTGLPAQIGLANLGPSGVASVGISSAPLAAIQARAQLRGLRVRTVRWDGVLRQNWAVLEDVAHPERPLWAELTDSVEPLLDPGSSAAASSHSEAPKTAPPFVPKPMVMHYGDRVRLWRTERNVRIEMYATAEASAAIGDEVKLRIPGSGTDGDGGWRVVGVVRGPRDVEMEQ